eukprot:218971-Pyramimonas_sp.AAC.1
MANIPSDRLGDKERIDAFDLNVQVAMLQARGWRDLNDDLRSCTETQQKDGLRINNVELKMQVLENTQSTFVSRATQA